MQQTIKRRIEITTVTEQTLTIRPMSVRAFHWCAACGEATNMVTPDQAAAIAQVFMRVIFQRVESGQLHFIETPDGKLLICVNSLERPYQPVESPTEVHASTV
jgi:hypothetical protein